jgi:MoaA/NifB/PqqE/SkfB family radical SAM enzyme
MNNCFRIFFRIIFRIVIAVRNLILRATTGSLKPHQLWFEVTDVCNSRCKFCNIWRKESDSDVLSPEEIEKIFNDSLLKNLKYIVLSGGEPFIRNDLDDIILRIHKILPKAQILIGTNCSLPERVINLVKTAIKNDINIGIGISLEGVGKSHDLIRGVDGLFERVDSLLRQLLLLKGSSSGRLTMTIGFVLSDLTLSTLEEVKVYARKLNIPLHVQWYNQASYYGNIGKNLLNNRQDIINAVNLLPRTIIHDMGMRQLEGKSIRFPCFAMFTFLLMKCNGDIVPCFNLWEEKVGNCRDNNLSQIWRSYKSEKARLKVKHCKGCLNACGIGWSFDASFYQIPLFYLKNTSFIKTFFNNGRKLC